MNYSPDWDLATIPTEAWRSEAKRRAARQRRNPSGGRNGGRPPKPTNCRRCGTLCPSAREAWTHCEKTKGHE